MYKHNTPQIPRQNRQKNYLISNLRVLAILLVVLGHSIIIYDPNWTTYNTPFHSVFFGENEKNNKSIPNGIILLIVRISVFLYNTKEI